MISFSFSFSFLIRVYHDKRGSPLDMNGGLGGENHLLTQGGRRFIDNLGARWRQHTRALLSPPTYIYSHTHTHKGATLLSLMDLSPFSISSELSSMSQLCPTRKAGLPLPQRIHSTPLPVNNLSSVIGHSSAGSRFLG
jgi:hypothetical protein